MNAITNNYKKMSADLSVRPVNSTSSVDSGGQGGRMVSFAPDTKQDPPENNKDGDEEDLDDDQEELGSPIAIMMYEFFTQPESSNYAQGWSIFLVCIVLVRIITIGLESVNGPNQFHHREVSRPRYKFLLTDEEYFSLYIAVMVPLILDAFGRLVFVTLLFFEPENRPLFHRFVTDKLEKFLFVADILGVVPFFATAIYVRPQNVLLSQAGRITLRLLELLITGRIMRAIKRFPAIQAITTALGNAIEHLVLPLFFFFVFNITFGVFFYFAEPCYDSSVCPWINLFESTFFSIVTMTTTGYGNQVPAFELGRFIACSVMLFGALFLSMPLAIIGNEYDKAWSQIQDSLAEERRQLQERANRQQLTSPGSGGNNNTDSGMITPRNASSAEAETVSSPVVLAPLTFADKRNLVAQYSCVTICDQIRVTLNQVQRDVKHHQAHVSHHVLTSLCELKAWISSLIISTEDLLRTTTLLSNKAIVDEQRDIVAPPVQQAAPRRFSIVHGGGRLMMRDLAPVAAAAPPVYRNNAVVPVHPPTTSFVPSFYSKQGSNKSLVDIQEGGSDDDDSESSLSLSDLDEDTDIDQIMQKNSLKKLEAINKSNNSINNINKPVLKKKVSSLDSHSISSDSDDNQPTPQQAFSSDPASGDNLGSTQSLTQPHQHRPSAMLTGTHHDDDDSDTSSDNSLEIQLRHRPPQPTEVANNSTFPPPQRSRTSIYVKMLKAIGVQDKVSRRRTVSEEFINKMEQVTQDPTSWKSRVWIMLELPHSSKEARALQILIIILICLSILVLYTQTIVNLSAYGENGRLCGRLLEKYCEDKFDRFRDPGCYVQSVAGPTTEKLRFECDSGNCFGYGLNFGSYHTNMSCFNATAHPFQLKSELEYRYGKPYLFTPREEMHRVNPVCSRIECIDNTEEYFDGRPMWTATEFVTNIIFTVELLLRIVVADSLRTYCQDKMNVFDVLAVFPFYTELVTTAGAGFGALDFSILASSPEPIFFVTMRSLKVFRLLKLTRHFRASKVLWETADRVWRQILGMLALLAFMVTLFSIVLYEMERGRACYVGDSNCPVPASIADVVHYGDLIYINKEGQASQFSNVFFGVWFSFVTLTSTGYGDIVPVTNGGQFMAIFLMISGSFYMAMPLTAAASTFYTVHEKYNEKHGNSAEDVAEKNLLDSAGNSDAIAAGPDTSAGPPGETVARRSSLNLVDTRLQLSIRYSVSELKQREEVLQNLVSGLVLIPDVFTPTGTVRSGGGRGTGRNSSVREQKNASDSVEDGGDPNDPIWCIRRDITHQCKVLDDTISNCERDIVELLTRFHSLLNANKMS